MDRDIQIRNMTLADYDSIYRLWSDTAGMGLRVADDSRAGIQAYLQRNPCTCFVALRGQSTVGAILSGHDGRRGYLYHLAVAESERNRGIGGSLLQAALEALAREGICKAALVVFSDNEVGNRFWERYGFSERKDLIYRNKALE